MSASREQLYDRWTTILRLYPDDSLTPTLEIDEAWHAHMARGSAYDHDCLERLGYVPLHHPDCDESERQRAFERLKQIWADTFAEQLNGCAAMCTKAANV